MPEGEKYWGVPVVIICPPPVGIGLTDLPNIGEASGPLGPLVPASLLCYTWVHSERTA